MYRLETSFAFSDITVEVGCTPVNGANDLVSVQDDSFHNADVHNADAHLRLALHSLDGNPITNLNLGGLFGLLAILPSQHPEMLFDESFVLMLRAVP
jgi:hypothetical protein